MKKHLLLGAVVVCSSLLVQASRADIVVNFPEINYIYGIPGTGPYPSPVIDWDTEGYSIPLGDHIVSAEYSGIWGETSQFYGSTASAQLYINGILVSDTTTLNPNPNYNVVPFSYDFTAAQFASLAGGSATLSFAQTAIYEVRLSDSTLDIKVTPNSAPDAGSISTMLGLSLAGLAGFRRAVRKA